ncbi:hypothetical protein NUW54_g9906 [Trametes sanguinea]|uniref:Uncharacterized protein n=1 Tax=Trametes sanguinea TaxID=158606 RepID=A0ACC1P2T4_9APHY|nr:hypothetical protein NUW54_g9906 [Trametes sanguinea]
MPDIPTATIAAGTKPLVKILLKFRPGKMVKKASKAERTVTNLLYNDTVVLPDNEFELLIDEREKVDIARCEAMNSKWFPNTYRHIKITYQYYASANELLRLAYRLTDPAKRLRGQEGQRVAAMRGQIVPAAAASVPLTGRLASYIIQDVCLIPGNNIVSIPCPSSVAEMATIEVKLQSVGNPGAAATGWSYVIDDGRVDLTDETASISISFTTLSGSDLDGTEDGCNNEMTIKLSQDKGKARGPGPSSRAALDTTIEIDVTDIPDGWRVDF